MCEGTNFEFSSVSSRGEEENLCLDHHAIPGEHPDTDLDEKILIFWQLTFYNILKMCNEM